MLQWQIDGRSSCNFKGVFYRPPWTLSKHVSWGPPGLSGGPGPLGPHRNSTTGYVRYICTHCDKKTVPLLFVHYHWPLLIDFSVYFSSLLQPEMTNAHIWNTIKIYLLVFNCIGALTVYKVQLSGCSFAKKLALFYLLSHNEKDGAMIRIGFC